jgi:hypothetical protein
MPRWWEDAILPVASLRFALSPGFMLYTRLLSAAPAPLVRTYAYVTPLVGAVMGARDPPRRAALARRVLGAPCCSGPSRSSRAAAAAPRPGDR